LNDNDFDKKFNQIWNFSLVAIIIGGIVSLILAGVSVWVIIYIVTHIGVWFG
jgi:hypothetical protein